MFLCVCIVGLLCGFLLMARVPRYFASPYEVQESVAIIIPARNEEQNLPRLLASLSQLNARNEIIVVDDNSTDRTAEIARAWNAHVLQAGELPANFTGKAWACMRGAETTTAEHLFFLDADTFFLPEGLENILSVYFKTTRPTALSVLPFAVTQQPYEELSLFFNLLMAFGAGGFGLFTSPRLLGQSLLLRRRLYEQLGGHRSVSSRVLENLHLSNSLVASQAHALCLAGHGTLHMRMFPQGLAQLCNGWSKAFADGASSTKSSTLLLASCWLTALMTVALATFLAPASWRIALSVVYMLAALQVFFFARQIGSFRILTCLLYPLPLVFFFVLFTRSAIRRKRGQTTTWRGRQV